MAFAVHHSVFGVLHTIGPKTIGKASMAISGVAVTFIIGRRRSQVMLPGSSKVLGCSAMLVTNRFKIVTQFAFGVGLSLSLIHL